MINSLMDLQVKKMESTVQKFFLEERSSVAGLIGVEVGALTHEFQQTSLGKKDLFDAMEYAFQSGGKRTRPRLVFLAAEELQVPDDKAIYWAAALEMIHTFSLIHDDLPCMDNDHLRRGLPTTHVKYGESMALLAGDALAIYPFQFLSEAFELENKESRVLLQVLSRLSGLSGMIMGQAMDVKPELEVTCAVISEMHRLKTAALFRACTEGIAHLKYFGDADQVKRWAQLGEKLGLAFQLKDDLLDRHTDIDREKNFALTMGEEKCRQQLESINVQLRSLVADLKLKSSSWSEMVEWNSSRHT